MIVSLLIFFLILIVLIIAHELGHFSVAKLFGIRVDEFGIFFPPRLWATRLGETEYTINSLPFGGFVKIFGENVGEGGDDPRSFTRKTRPVQAAVLCAGIVFNILFAWLVLSAGFMVGMQTSADHFGFGQVQHAQTEVVSVVPGSPAEKAGLLQGDVIESLQTGTDALPAGISASAVQQFIAAHGDQSIIFTVKRGGAEEHLLATPQEGIVAGHKAVGIEMDDIGTLKLSPFFALGQGAIFTEQLTVATADGLAHFFETLVHGTANWSGVAGPIGIASIGSSAVRQGVVATIILTALISINLALINLLPIPGLDGGRLLFVVVEAIIRRPISEQLAFRLTVAGFALLITLMVVVSFHDILRLAHPAA